MHSKKATERSNNNESFFHSLLYSAVLPNRRLLFSPTTTRGFVSLLSRLPRVSILKHQTLYFHLTECAFGSEQRLKVLHWLLSLLTRPASPASLQCTLCYSVLRGLYSTMSHDEAISLCYE